MVPITLIIEPPVIVTVRLPELLARRSAIPAGCGVVVTSTIRKRNRVTEAPVLLVNFLRKSNVPKVELLGMSGVVSRTRFGDADEATPVSIRLALIVAFRWIGLARFSGPGAPRPGVPVEPTGVAGVVVTSWKSARLSLPSCGVPDASFLTKLYSEVLPAAAGRFVPSRNKSQLLPVFAAIQQHRVASPLRD